MKFKILTMSLISVLAPQGLALYLLYTLFGHGPVRLENRELHEHVLFGIAILALFWAAWELKWFFKLARLPNWVWKALDRAGKQSEVVP